MQILQTTLATSRNIAGQAFNGSADVTIEAGNLSDVSTSGVSDGQVLVYKNAASQFEPGSVGSATALIDGDSRLYTYQMVLLMEYTTS